jgi:5-methylcytosine-specific restriction endonuclease McrA
MNDSDFRLPNQPPVLPLMGHALHYQRTLWRGIRKAIIARDGHKCWFCGAEETFKTVSTAKVNYTQSELDAHEIFNFDDRHLIRTLRDIRMACPTCHTCAHICYPGTTPEIIEHFSQINQCSILDAKKHFWEAFKKWQWRNKRDWVNCLSWDKYEFPAYLAISEHKRRSREKWRGQLVIFSEILKTGFFKRPFKFYYGDDTIVYVCPETLRFCEYGSEVIGAKDGTLLVCRLCGRIRKMPPF